MLLIIHTIMHSFQQVNNLQLYLLKFMSTSLLHFVATYLLILFANAAGVNWNDHSDIRTGYKVMYQSPNSTSFFRAIDTPVSYYIVYNRPISTTRSAGVGIVGFHSVISYDYSMNTTVENFTTYSLRLTARVYGDTVLSFYAVNWIAVGNIPDFVEVLFNCHLCTNIRVGRGDRSEYRTGVTLFANYANLFVNVYLSGFSLRNVDGITNYLKATASIASMSSTINYQFTVNQNNTVSQLCYTTIIYNDIITKVQYYNWGWTGSNVLSNQASQTPSTISFPTAMPNSAVDYRDEDRMFFGMSAFNLSRASNRRFRFDTTQYASLSTNYATNQGTYAVTIDFFMIAVRSCNASDRFFDIYDMDCQNNCNNPSNNPTRYETDPGSFCYGCHYTCDNCAGSHSGNCTSCDQLMFRQLVSGFCNCNSSYIDIGVKLCYPCETFIPGCDTCQSTTLCLSCFPGFLLQPNGFCQCTSGFLVSGVCTNITGCTSLVLYAGTTFCLSCNSTLNFQTTSSYTCQCMPGYYITSNWLCSPRCGDSRQITEEGCDDGNTINGDGCSSTCFTEANWICIGGSPTNRSICYIYDSSLRLQVKYVRRQTTMNRMQVGLKILPAYSQLQLINFKQFISHNVPCSYMNATYFNNYLVLQFDYNYTIESQFFDISLQLDPNVFYNTTLSAQIPASGMNAKLTYDSNNSINRPLQIIVIVLDVLAIIVMFATCISQRMIGIQMIQTLQTILYTQAVMKTTPSSLSPLQMLRYSSGYNEIQGIDYGRTFTFAFSLSSLGLEKQFLLSYNLMFILLMVVVILCIILKAKQYYHENKMGKFVHEDDETKNKIKFAKVTKIYNFIFQRVLFLLAFMCMFLVMFALMLQLTDMSSDYIIMSKQFNLLGAGVAMAIMSTMLCAVILNGCFPGTLLFPMLIKQYYPSIYFIYQATFIFVLAFVYTQEYVLYILISMSFVFMVYNLFHRPYPEKFHTFVLIFHQLLIMAVIGIYIFENLTKPTQNQTLYKIFTVVIIALLYIVVVLNAYRLYKYYNFIKLNGWDQYGNENYENQLEDNDENLKYRQLKTPKSGETPIKVDQKVYGTKLPDKSAKKKNSELVELQQIKRNNKDSNLKPIDQSAMNWKYNRLADQDNSRFQATNRDTRPDTSRDRPLNRTKTAERNKDGDFSFSNNKNNQNQNDNQDMNNLDDENTIKDIGDRNKNRSLDENNKKNNEIENRNENENVFDSPYDESGYVKKTNKTGEKVVEEEDDDPLQRIKRKLKQDFNSKLKTSKIMEY